MADLVSISKFDTPPGQWAGRVQMVADTAKKSDKILSPSPTRQRYDMGMAEIMAGAKSSPTRNNFYDSTTPVNVQWKNISLKTKEGKEILKEVSGIVKAGELTAIMGPSGAGKSTMLNVLSGFIRQKVSGQILVNGSPREMRVFSKLSCYIMQDDHLLPHLTVRESIYLAACLKIPSSVSDEERNRAVDDCMACLGLTTRAENKASQLSGGQRKRLCIAQEIVSNPPLLFLDEPTSGLDSSSCLQCVQLLKSLAEVGKTVVCTIHQPSARIFELFDKLYMLADGHCIYRGSTKNLLPFLAEQGLKCPKYHNPTDFAMDVACDEQGGWVRKLKTAVDSMDNIKEDFSPVEESRLSGQQESSYQSTLSLVEDKDKKPLFKKDSEKSEAMYATSAFNQFKVLTWRSFKCTIREPMTTHVRIISHIVVGLLFGALYYDIGNDASKIIDNSGCLFFSLMFMIFTAMMPTVITFPLEKLIIAREHLNSWYSIKIYFLATTIAEIPFQIIYPIIYSSIVYWMSYQPNDVDRFFMFLLSYIMLSLVAQSVGFLVGAATNVQNAVFMAPVVTIPFLLFSGFFITLNTIPDYLKWLSYISYTRYSFQSVLYTIYGMDREDLECDKIFCPFQDPMDYLKEMDMDDVDPYVDYSSLLVFFLVFRLMAYYMLWYKVVYCR